MLMFNSGAICLSYQKIYGLIQFYVENVFLELDYIKIASNELNVINMKRCDSYISNYISLLL